MPKIVMVLQSGWVRVLDWDTQLLIASSRSRRWWLTRAMRALTRAGDTAGWFVHGAVLAALLPDGASHVQLLVAGAVVGTALSQLLKRLCRRSRPDHAIESFAASMANPDLFSFPSGHSTVAFAVATALSSAHPVLGGLELALATAIACSRVGLGAHYPLDVTAGVLLGVASGLAATLLV
ncbi:MAG TPA: phosphatase PAP2 family protein [Candidatus Limnocylindrales bacterium]|nr:phosphatase PAP2 family protein [Candidatus Limnocylindrales bacterium]